MDVKNMDLMVWCTWSLWQMEGLVLTMAAAAAAAT